MNVAISNNESVILNKSTLTRDGAVFARADVNRALRGNKTTFSLKCTCLRGCLYRQTGRINKSGSVRVGCTLIPKETVAIIRKWANAKQK